MIDCENCGEPFNPEHHRWLSPCCHLKHHCCEGAPLGATTANSDPRAIVDAIQPYWDKHHKPENDTTTVDPIAVVEEMKERIDDLARFLSVTHDEALAEFINAFNDTTTEEQ